LAIRLASKILTVKKEKQMQKWEYLTLWSEGPKYEINGGGERTYMAYENVFKFLNKFGKEGWELVAQPSPQIWTFKRMMEE
jgi:hypothetical protein